MNVKKTKSSKKIVLKITMSMTSGFSDLKRAESTIYNRLLRRSQDEALVVAVPLWLSGTSPRQKTWCEQSSPYA